MGSCRDQIILNVWVLVWEMRYGGNGCNEGNKRHSNLLYISFYYSGKSCWCLINCFF